MAKVWADIKAEIEERQRAEYDYTRDVECKHEATDFRRYAIAGGTLTLRRQCLACGDLVGNAFARNSVPDFNALPMVDEIALQKSRGPSTDRREVSQRQADEKSATFWKLYEEHLRSPEWRQICGNVMRRAAGRCEGCGNGEPRHVHHQTYEHLGDEFLFELVALCLNCHQRIHPHREIA